MALRLLIDRAGKVGTDYSIETAFEQPAIFEFVCHLLIKQRQSAQDVLRLSIRLTPCCFLLMIGAFQKFLLSKTDIHGPPIQIIQIREC